MCPLAASYLRDSFSGFQRMLSLWRPQVVHLWQRRKTLRTYQLILLGITENTFMGNHAVMCSTQKRRFERGIGSQDSAGLAD
jgi:hypothetical protein